MKLTRQHLRYLIICIPVFAFFGFFFYYMVDAPINDDYALLDFIDKCISTDSLSEKAGLIFAQHNEHRIVYDRIWTILSYKISDSVNFTFLALLGNLSLIGIAFLFFRKFKNLNKELLLFFPVTVLLFNISSWENMTFAMATLSNFTVIYFALLSLYYLSSETLVKKKNLFLGILFFALAILTQGGGLFLFPLSVLILVYKKEYKNILIYLTFTLPMVFLYFYDYKSPGSSKGIVSSLIEYNFEIIPFLFAFLGNATNYYLIYTGSLKNSTVLSLIFGVIFFLVFIYITYKKYYKQNLFIYSVLLFFIISACVTSVSRVSFGLDAAGASRYRINGIIFLIALYFWLIETYNLKKLYITITLVVTVGYFYFFSLKQVEYLDVRQKQTYTGVLMQNIGISTYLNGDKNDVTIYNMLLNNAKNSETYCLPSNEDILDYFPYGNEHSLKPLKLSTNDLAYNIDTITELNDSYLVEGWAFLGDENTCGQKVYVGVTNGLDNTAIFYSTKQYSRYDVNTFFKKNNLRFAGYLGRIRKNDLKSGENKISLMIEVNGMTKTVLTDKKIIK